MRWLVVGGGSIGRRHLANLLALDAGDVELCEPDAPRREALTQALRVRAHARLEDALARRPEAVLVCTPTHLHLPVAIEALQAGAHLFIEKPLAASLEGTEEFVAAAKAHNRIVLVGCNMRFHPGVATIQQALRQGVVKLPWQFSARFSHYLPHWRPGQDYRQTYHARYDQGGGIVMEGVHELDYLRWMGGEIEIGELKSYVCLASRVNPQGVIELDSGDAASLAFRFATGAFGQINLAYLSPCKLRSCEVSAHDGILSWTSEGKQPERLEVKHFEARSGLWRDLYRHDNYDSNDMYVKELRHFFDCITGSAQPMLDAEQARRVLELAVAARDQARLSTPTWVMIP